MPALLDQSETPRKGRFSLIGAIPFASGGLLILSWLTTEHFIPWVSWHSEALAFLAAFLLAWAGVFRSWRAGTQVCVPLVVLPFLLIGLVAALQFAAGMTSFGGDVVVIWFYVALAVASLMVGFCPGSETDGVPSKGRVQLAEIVAFATLAGAFISAIFAFAQLFDLWLNSPWIVRLYEIRRPGANLSQPNQLATLLVMGMASAGFLYVAGQVGRWPAALMLLVLIAGLVATESRAGVIALTALLVWWQLKRPVLAKRTSPWAAPVLGLVFMAMSIAWPRALQVLQLEPAAEHRFSSGDIRLAMWSQLLDAIVQRPWWGWGVMGVSEALNGVAHDHRINNPFTYSHNIVIDWAIWMGVPLAVLLLIVSIVWLWRRMKGVTLLGPWYCVAVVLPLLTHSMLEFPYAYAYFLVPALLLVGLLERSAGAGAWLRISPAAACLFLVAFTLPMIWSVREYFAIEEEFRILRFEQMHIGRSARDRAEPEVVLFTQLGELLTGLRIELRAGMSPAELAKLKSLALRYPWVATQYRYSFALALNGQQNEAVRQLQVLRWQRGERVYSAIKSEIASMGKERYPELRSLALP